MRAWGTMGVMAGWLGACADDGNGAPERLPSEAAPPPPVTSVRGSCPGPVTIEVEGATPGGRVAILSASQPGSTLAPGGPCAGIELELDGRVVVRDTVSADNAGRAVLSPNLPGGACNAWLTAVDLSSCTASNAATPERGSFHVGGTDESWVATSFFRGNSFVNQRGGTLERFKVYLGPRSNCDLDFYVHGRQVPGMGPWTMLAHNASNVQQGERFFDSGVLNVPLRAGAEYGIGVAWSCSAEYFGKTASWPGDFGVGEYAANYWDNAFPGHMNGYVPPNMGGAGLAYSQVIVATP